MSTSWYGGHRRVVDAAVDIAWTNAVSKKLSRASGYGGTTIICVWHYREYRRGSKLAGVLWRGKT
jgi:hypothetical protein